MCAWFDFDLKMPMDNTEIVNFSVLLLWNYGVNDRYMCIICAGSSILK